MGLLYVNRSEVAATRNARDEMLNLTLLRCLANGRARRIGIVRIFDLNWNIGLAHRKYRVLLEHRRSHIGQLAHLIKRNAVNGTGVVNYARIGRQEP